MHCHSSVGRWYRRALTEHLCFHGLRVGGCIMQFSVFIVYLVQEERISLSNPLKPRLSSFLDFLLGCTREDLIFRFSSSGDESVPGGSLSAEESVWPKKALLTWRNLVWTRWDFCCPHRRLGFEKFLRCSFIGFPSTKIESSAAES